MTSRALAIASVLTGTLLAQARNPVDLVNAPVPSNGQRLTYGADPLQFGELRLPAGTGPHPVAIIVHGGCWAAKLANLDQRVVSMELLRPFAAALTDAGIATWNIEYRRLGNPGGGWPGTFQDVARAADFIRTLATQNHLDLNRVIVIGHSSGGHLAMWLAARQKLSKASELYVADPVHLAGVVDLDGPVDLKATIPMQQQACGAPVITNLIGGTPEEQPQRYHDASPIELLPLGVPQAIFAGRVFAAGAESYEAATRRAGDSIQSIVVPTGGHFIFVDPQSENWPQVLKAVRRMLSMSN